MVEVPAIELVHSIYADWERGEFTNAEWAHPEIEFVIADGPAAGRWSGVAALTEAFRSSIRPWAEWSIEAEEFRELDGEHVLVLQRYGGVGKTSGLDLADMRSEGANMFHVTDGKVTRLVTYFDRRIALADLDAGRFGR